MALNEAREKVAQLQNALKRLDFIKKHLNRNTLDIKKEIHSCVSRNLECLRNREVALLGQVDEVLSVKEESLHQQQAHLNQAIGVLTTEMAMMIEDSTFEKQLRETLEKLNRMELSPGETPHIAFRADHVNLKESIVKYGRVDANGLSFAAFEDPDIPSASLPRHLEDYEDVDHHVFIKPVQEMGTSNITVAIPKLSNRIEDWLLNRIPSSKAPNVPALPLAKVSSPLSSQAAGPKQGKETDKSTGSTPSDSCSLNNWLSLIKNHADLEEEHDFEIVDNTNYSVRDAQYGTETGDCEMPYSSDFFSHINKDIKMWLKSTPKGYHDVKDDKTYNFFQHIPEGAEAWLSKASRQLNSLELVTDTDFFKHVNHQPSTWLRSRAHTKYHQTELSSSKSFDEEAIKCNRKEELSKWLSVAIPPSKIKFETKVGDINGAFSKDHSKWLQRSCNGSGTPSDFQLEEVCRANELCSSASECVSQPNCSTFCQQKSMKNPIDPLTVFKPQELPMSQWLASSTEKKENFALNTPVNSRTNASSWLYSSTSSCSRVSNSDVNPKESKDEVNLWLSENRQSAQEASHGDNQGSITFYPGTSLTDWLMTPASSTDSDYCKEREHNVEKDFSEGWSLCSSPASINGEQYTKDIETATDYMKKWIL